MVPSVFWTFEGELIPNYVMFDLFSLSVCFFVFCVVFAAKLLGVSHLFSTKLLSANCFQYSLRE
jgi:hypothetical protein